MRRPTYTLSRTCKDCARTFVAVLEPGEPWPERCPDCFVPHETGPEVEHDLGGEA